jgi:hypothetical protein
MHYIFSTAGPSGIFHNVKKLHQTDALQIRSYDRNAEWQEQLHRLHLSDALQSRCDSINRCLRRRMELHLSDAQQSRCHRQRLPILSVSRSCIYSIHCKTIATCSTGTRFPLQINHLKTDTTKMPPNLPPKLRSYGKRSVL